MKNLKMRVLFKILSFAASMLLVFSCGSKNQGTSGAVASEVKEVYEVKGVSFQMKELPGGTFGMGARGDKAHIKGSNVTHQVVLDGYAISVSPVSQALWKAVMGNNPSSVENPDLPVDRVSWDDCRKFVSKLSKLTGVPFRLPSEAMWEFAYDNGAIEDVKSMDEWCSDWFVETPAKAISMNPEGGESGNMRTVRNALERKGFTPVTKAGALGFRLAVRTDKTCPAEIVAAVVDKVQSREHSCKSETIAAGSQEIKMVPVKGGSFNMGCDFKTDASDPDEYPVHEVSVEDFEMAVTEVTVGLWKEVMGTIPVGNYTNVFDTPVINISWYAAQEFILKLNAMTGRKFRLPTEAEWEYAARGGSRSSHYRYSGGDYISYVGAIKDNSEGRPVAVKSFRPNELGIYDMSGNAWEWCQEEYLPYDGSPVEGEVQHVLRGGSYSGTWEACRVSNRQASPPDNTKSTFGFRLAI